MKISSYYFLVTLILLMVVSSCKNTEKKTVKSDVKYTCPMHPQIVQDAPGTCPICKMDLVPMNRGGNDMELTLNASQIQLAGVQTLKVGTSSFGSSKVLNARLLSNPEATEVIASKFPGRIEKLFVKETGRMLAAGSPVFSIYSEELLTLQQDYLLQVKQVAAFPAEKIYLTLKNAAANKLSLFGYSQKQIKALINADQTSARITVFAKRSGLVKEINVSEGAYINEGTAVVSLEDLGQLWVEADVYPSEVNLLKTGMNVNLKVNGIQKPGQAIQIDYISPQLNPGTQLLTIRGKVENPSGDLQPGMQAVVLLPSASVNNAIRLPLEAVIRSAEGAHIWIKNGKNTFTPRNVVTGAEDARAIVITSGLKGGEEVVISGAYLLYSEFVLKKGADPLTAHQHK